jgi:hypothetical protein
MVPKTQKEQIFPELQWRHVPDIRCQATWKSWTISGLLATVYIRPSQLKEKGGGGMKVAETVQ